MDFGFCSLSFFYSKLELSALTACTVQSMIKKINDSVAKKTPTNNTKKIIISNVRVKTKRKKPKTTTRSRVKKSIPGKQICCVILVAPLTLFPSELLFFVHCLFSSSSSIFFFFLGFELLCFIYCSATQLQSIVIFIIIYLFTAHRHLLFPNVYQQKLLTRFSLLFAQREHGTASAATTEGKKSTNVQ